jgi:hypothetical protein
MKKNLVFMMILAFVFGMANLGFAASESYPGTITKINGAKITVRNDKGGEKIVTANMPGLKIGDKVTVNGGEIIKAGGTAINPDLNPQPDPPMNISPKGKGQSTAAGGSTPEAPSPPPKTSPKLK